MRNALEVQRDYWHQAPRSISVPVSDASGLRRQAEAPRSTGTSGEPHSARPLKGGQRAPCSGGQL
eukprot:2428111-Prymnesium_polylepis.2